MADNPNITELDEDYEPRSDSAVEINGKLPGDGSTEYWTKDADGNLVPADGEPLSVGNANITQGANFNGSPIEQLRTPTLTYEKRYPSTRQPYHVVWVDGDTVYGASRHDRSIHKSTDGGLTWTEQATFEHRAGVKGCFLKLPGSGTLLSYDGDEIFRSADDGESWSQVRSLRTDTELMGVGSWTFDPTNDDVYYGEYGTSGLNHRVYRSTDDGETWNNYHEFDSSTLRHIHALEYDDVSDYIYIMTGDTESDAGIYRTDGNGTVEPVYVNSQSESGYAARSIGMMFFDDYLAWGTDSPEDPFLYRLPRSEIGASNPTEEKIYRLNSVMWWACEAAPNRDAYIISAGNEGGEKLDSVSHLYYVTDEGQTIHEVASLPIGDENNHAAAGPVGSQRLYDDTLWLRSFQMEPEWQTKVKVAQSGTEAFPSFAQEQETHPSITWQTVSSGEMTISPSSTETFFETRPAGHANTDAFYIYNMGISELSGSGNGRLRVYENTSGGLDQLHNIGDLDHRNAKGKQRRNYLYKHDIANDSTVDIRLNNTDSSNDITVNGFITFGWA